jgi:hypothetical protein
MAKRVIPQRDEIEIFINERGFIAIKQSDAAGNVPAVVDLPHEDIPKLIVMLTDAMEERKQHADQEYEPPELCEGPNCKDKPVKQLDSDDPELDGKWLCAKCLKAMTATATKPGVAKH